ncbi:MAG: Holliday junction branch migration DNA helicase RuvB, partial [Deltaproteobacteria bacterium]|nr:Holliday junction branch migration DNA helicase RuvB [Deltaproteobacteria bacterium]
DGVINSEIVEETLDRLGIDDIGLDRLDRTILRQMIEVHQGGPVGVSTIAATVAEEIDAIQEVVEPYLLQTGMIRRTPRGRMVTSKTYQHLGIPEPSK